MLLNSKLILIYIISSIAVVFVYFYFAYQSLDEIPPKKTKQTKTSITNNSSPSPSIYKSTPSVVPATVVVPTNTKTDTISNNNYNWQDRDYDERPITTSAIIKQPISGGVPVSVDPIYERPSPGGVPVSVDPVIEKPKPIVIEVPAVQRPDENLPPVSILPVPAPISDDINKDCVGAWNEWSKCPANTCDVDTFHPTYRHYRVISPEVGLGQKCPFKDGASEISFCHVKKKCPPPPGEEINDSNQQCLGKWVEINKCSSNIPCGKDRHKYKRFEYQSSNPDDLAGCTIMNGTIEEVLCPSTPCPLDCKGEWTDWQACEPTPCGEMTTMKREFTTRKFKVTQPAMHGGEKCEYENDFVEEEDCPMTPCPVDCKGEWSKWTTCDPDRKCGTQSSVYRTFNITTPGELGGKECVKINPVETSNCPVIPCVQDCVGKFEEWDTKCEDVCNDSNQVVKRLYTISKDAENGGKKCEHEHGFVESSNCPLKICPIDCLGEWSAWDSLCDKKYENDQKITRKYTIKRNAANGGVKCPVENNTIETSNCPFIMQPVNCEGEWSQWSDCPSFCGVEGISTRVYNVKTQPKFDGTACPYTDGVIESKFCDVSPCPVDCKGEWSNLKVCNPDECDKLNKSSQMFIHKQNKAYGGKDCEYPDKFIKETLCPACDMCEGEWSEWSQCICGSNQTRSFYITKTGLACDHSNGEIESRKCPECPVDCEAEWSDWNFACSNQCNEHQTVQRYYRITKPSANGGVPCQFDGKSYSNITGIIGSDSSNCPYVKCPENCMGNWSDWTKCANVCNSNQQIEREFIVANKNFDGSNCEHEDGFKETSNCLYTPCPVDCVGNWSEWSQCSQPCKPYELSERVYTITTPAEHNGKECEYQDSYIMRKDCPVCNIDCVGEWDTLIDCTSNCDVSSTKISKYTIKTFKEGQGASCEYNNDTIQTSNCPIIPCPVPCQGGWTEWPVCSNACNSNQTIEREFVVSNKDFDGEKCEYEDGLKETSNCPFTHCPINCEGGWSDWDKNCSSECISDVGILTQDHKTRTFSVNKKQEHGGTECEYPDGEIEIEACPMVRCPINCEGKWSDWSSCPTNNMDSNICNHEIKVDRIFTITTSNQYGGSNCRFENNTIERSNCPILPCPEHCEGEWSAWNPCSEVCQDDDTATPTLRTYRIVKPPSYGGSNCRNEDGETQSSNCPIIRCPIDCEGDWGEWTVCSSNPLDCGKKTFKTRNYTITTSNQYDGYPCKNMYGQDIVSHYSNVGSNTYVERGECPMTACVPINCVGNWSQWSPCTYGDNATCINESDDNVYISSNLTQRTYSIIQESQNDGSACEFENNAIQTSNCPINYCPINCVGSWTDWTECPTGCEATGDTTRTYEVTTFSKYGGSNCQYINNYKQTKKCPVGACDFEFHTYTNSSEMTIVTDKTVPLNESNKYQYFRCVGFDDEEMRTLNIKFCSKNWNAGQTTTNCDPAWVREQLMMFNNPEECRDCTVLRLNREVTEIPDNITNFGLKLVQVVGIDHYTPINIGNKYIELYVNQDKSGDVLRVKRADKLDWTVEEVTSTDELTPDDPISTDPQLDEHGCLMVFDPICVCTERDVNDECTSFKNYNNECLASNDNYYDIAYSGFCKINDEPITSDPIVEDPVISDPDPVDTCTNPDPICVCDIFTNSCQTKRMCDQLENSEYIKNVGYCEDRPPSLIDDNSDPPPPTNDYDRPISLF